MSLKTSTLLLTLSLLSLLPLTSSLTLKDYEIRDLEFNSHDFISEASKWTVSATDPYGLTYTNCGTTYILGGFEVTWVPNVTFTRTYQLSQTHNTAFISIDFWLLGSWDVFDTISFKISTTTSVPFSQTVYPVVPPATLASMTCGSASVTTMMPVTVVVQVPHTSSDLTLEIKCTSQYIPGEGLASCGFRNIRILASSLVKTVGITSITNPGVTGILTSIAKGCLIGEYKNPTTNLCASCDGSCENCLDQTTTGCISCKNQKIYDGTYCTGCHADCLSCSGTGSSQCLSCGLGKFLYNNGTCMTSCNSPYIKNTRNGIQYCDFPCRKGLYLYPDGSCIGSCPSPMLIKTADDELYCDTPCDLGSYYYIKETSCRPTCEYPYSLIQKNYYMGCYLPNRPDSVDYLLSVTGHIGSIGLMITSILSSSDPMAILIGSLSMMSHYVGYLNVTFSEEYEKRLSLQHSSSISIDFWASRQVYADEDFEKSPVPYIFKKHNLQPSFIENFLPVFIILITVAGLVLALRVTEVIYFKFKPKMLSYTPINKTRIIIQNFLLTLFYISYPLVLFFSILDFKSPRQRINLDGFSAGVFILLVLIGLRIFWVHLKVVRAQKKMLDEDLILTTDDLEEYYEKNKSIQVLFRGCEVTPFLAHLFLLISIGRAVLFALILILFYQSPLFQIIGITIMSFIMLIYMVCLGPLKSRIQQISQMIFEFILLIINLCVLAMAALDYQQKLEITVREGLCRFMLAMNVLFNFLVIGYVITTTIIFARNARKQQKLRKVNSITSEIRIIPKPSLTEKSKRRFIPDDTPSNKPMDQPGMVSEDQSEVISFRPMNLTPNEGLSAWGGVRAILPKEEEIAEVKEDEGEMENSFVKESKLFKYGMEQGDDKTIEEEDSTVSVDLSENRSSKEVLRNDSLVSMLSSGLGGLGHDSSEKTLVLSQSLRARRNQSLRPKKAGNKLSNFSRLESHHHAWQGPPEDKNE